MKFLNILFFLLSNILLEKSFAQPTVYPPFGCKATSSNIVYYNYLSTVDNGKYVLNGTGSGFSIFPYLWDTSTMNT